MSCPRMKGNESDTMLNSGLASSAMPSNMAMARDRLTSDVGTSSEYRRCS